MKYYHLQSGYALEKLTKQEPENWVYVQIDHNDFDHCLEYVGFPENDRGDITGLLINVSDGDYNAVFLTESNRPYALDVYWRPLPFYRPDHWNTENLPVYWLESNTYYHIEVQS